LFCFVDTPLRFLLRISYYRQLCHLVSQLRVAMIPCILPLEGTLSPSLPIRVSPWKRSAHTTGTHSHMMIQESISRTLRGAKAGNKRAVATPRLPPHRSPPTLPSGTYP
jgi:hypothetical protein